MKLAKLKMNCYYSLTDSSSTYCIAWFFIRAQAGIFPTAPLGGEWIEEAEN